MAQHSDPMQEVRDFFEGPAPAAKFELAKDSISGMITGMVIRQQTNPDTGDPLFFKSGDPRMQVVITLQTEETAEDDGLRSLYVRGEMRKAIVGACLASGVKSPQIGGFLKVTYTGDGEPARKGLNGPKLYDAEYQQPGTTQPPF
jgi:hypothetical protein